MSLHQRISFCLIFLLLPVALVLVIYPVIPVQVRLVTPKSIQQSMRYDQPTFTNSQGSFNGTWDWQRDSKNLLLTSSQCDLAFPGLYEEIDRAAKHNSQQKVRAEQINNVGELKHWVRGVIYDRELYVTAFKEGHVERQLASLLAIYRAITTSLEPVPNIEFLLVASDKTANRAAWSYTRRAEDLDTWVIPDFGYWAWPQPKVGSYGEVQHNARQMEVSWQWAEKLSTLVWRGALLGRDIRKNFVNAVSGMEWADVEVLNWHDGNSVGRHLLTMAEHCRYKFVGHVEGHSYSGRLKYLQNCRSVVVTHELDWIQHHHHLFVPSGPDQNIVIANRSFSDLNEKMNFLRHNDEVARRIADNSVRTFRERYLTPAAEACYWRKLITAWREASYEPDFPLNGVPIESFILERRLDWDPY